MAATTPDSVDDLARELLDPDRRLPVAVVSIPENAEHPLVDVAEIERSIGELGRVVTIRTGELTYRLESLLPEKCQVYGGASRVYPVGTAWADNPYLSPLRFVHTASAGERVTDQLIDDALRMANEAGLVRRAPDSAPRESGTVSGIVASRAFVRLDSGGVATIHSELLPPAVPLEWAVAEGQRVTGVLDSASSILVPDGVPQPEGGLLARFGDGTVTLGLVGAVERQRAEILVHPDHPVTVTRPDVSSNQFDRVDLLLAEGDVVAVRIVRGADGAARLRLSDIDDDEPVAEALSVVEGGPPWLVEGRSLTIVDDASDAVDSGFDEGAVLELDKVAADAGAQSSTTALPLEGDPPGRRRVDAPRPRAGSAPCDGVAVGSGGVGIRSVCTEVHAVGAREGAG